MRSGARSTWPPEASGEVGAPSRLPTADGRRQTAESGGEGAAVMDADGEVDIVERALAILDEEWRAWMARRPDLASGREVVPPPAEPRVGGDDK